MSIPTRFCLADEIGDRPHRLFPLRTSNAVRLKLEVAEPGIVKRARTRVSERDEDAFGRGCRGSKVLELGESHDET